jgi:putative component of membrane protein insertase Oxa1/YidC/SpoIIIJ protein YidD
MKKYIFLFLLPLITTFSFEEPWGKDSDLNKKPIKKEKPKKTSLLTKIAHKIIIFHQKNFSPIDGPRSSFRPTSSRYMQLAMQRYGFFKGYLMGCDRLLRENSEKWVYRTIKIDNVEYKYDPAFTNKHIR